MEVVNGWDEEKWAGRERALSRILSASGKDRIAYYVGEDGFYTIGFVPHNLSGSLDAWVDVR